MSFGDHHYGAARSIYPPSPPLGRTRLRQQFQTARFPGADDAQSGRTKTDDRLPLQAKRWTRSKVSLGSGNGWATPLQASMLTQAPSDGGPLLPMTPLPQVVKAWPVLKRQPRQNAGDSGNLG